MAKAKSAVPAGHHTATPHLIMNDAASALDWYARALGAEELSRSLGPDGKVMHAEIRIGNSIIMLNDEMGGGKSAEGARRLADLAVALRRRLRRVVQACDRGRCHGSAGPDERDGRSVLGRSLRFDRRSGGLRLDDRDPQGRSDRRKRWTSARRSSSRTSRARRSRSLRESKGLAGLPPARPPYRASSA